MQIKLKTIHNSWPYVCIIFAVGFILYAQSLFFKLTYLDDNVWILEYFWYLKDLRNIPAVFSSHDFISDVFYRPVLNSTFMFNAYWGGKGLFGYHLVNIFIHAINGGLVFLLFLKLDYDRAIALVMALVFTVHPALTQAVVWIPGRTDSLLGMFILSAFIFGVYYTEKRRKTFLISHLIFFILALLVKETAVVFPFVFGTYFLVLFKRREIKSTIKTLTFWWVAVLFLWGILRHYILTGSTKVGVFVALKSLINNSPVFLVYLGKIFFPVNLSVLSILKDSTLLWGLLALSILTALYFLNQNKRASFIIFGASWFILFLLPSLVISFLTHEYRLYLPMVGMLIVIIELFNIREILKFRRTYILGSAVLIVLLSAVTFNYSYQFADQYLFWKNAVKHAPHSPLAHKNLGAMYHLDKNIDQAEKEYLEALKLNDREFMVYNNLGLIEAARGNYKLAEQYYMKEIKINPLYDNVYYNLGILRLGQKRLDEAKTSFKKTLELNPKNIASYEKLLSIYLGEGNLSEAKIYADQLEQRGFKMPKRLEMLLGK